MGHTMYIWLRMKGERLTIQYYFFTSQGIHDETMENQYLLDKIHLLIRIHLRNEHNATKIMIGKTGVISHNGFDFKRTVDYLTTKGLLEEYLILRTLYISLYWYTMTVEDDKTFPIAMLSKFYK